MLITGTGNGDGAGKTIEENFSVFFLI